MASKEAFRVASAEEAAAQVRALAQGPPRREAAGEARGRGAAEGSGGARSWTKKRRSAFANKNYHAPFPPLFGVNMYLLKSPLCIWWGLLGVDRPLGQGCRRRRRAPGRLERQEEAAQGVCRASCPVLCGRPRIPPPAAQEQNRWKERERTKNKNKHHFRAWSRAGVSLACGAMSASQGSPPLPWTLGRARLSGDYWGGR